jgi:hypothetical protein
MGKPAADSQASMSLVQKGFFTRQYPFYSLDQDRGHVKFEIAGLRLIMPQFEAPCFFPVRVV